MSSKSGASAVQPKEFIITLYPDSRLELRSSEGLQAYEVLGLLEFARTSIVKKVVEMDGKPLSKTYKDGKVRYSRDAK